MEAVKGRHISQLPSDHMQEQADEYRQKLEQTITLLKKHRELIQKHKDQYPDLKGRLKLNTFEMHYFAEPLKSSAITRERAFRNILAGFASMFDLTGSYYVPEKVDKKTTDYYNDALQGVNDQMSNTFAIIKDWLLELL